MIYINQLKMVHPDELNEASIVTVREDVELGKGAKIIKMKIQCFLTWQVELSAGYYPHIHLSHISIAYYKQKGGEGVQIAC